MSDNPAISVRNLGKKYVLGGPKEKYSTIRDAIVALIKAPIRPKLSDSSYFWALKGLSFDVRSGEVIGIIGRNGAGKSTLLKILSRITTPTEGSVDIYGRVGSLLEVGTGFHPELTGRENIYLSGSILGMKKREIDDKLDAIVKFSEIEQFLDTPAKRYSSGMYVRLAFAVAAHLEPEILLVDEVLAVGDIEFQKKCLGKMEDISKGGRTVLFVSHNMPAIERICSQAILLDHGRIIIQDETKKVIDAYISTITQKNFSPKKTGIFFSSFVLNAKRNSDGYTIDSWTPCIFETTINTPIPLKKCYINLHINDLQSRACIHLRTDYDDLFPDFSPGTHKLSVNIDSINLEGGSYSAFFRLVSDGNDVMIDSDTLVFTIARTYEKYEGVGSVVAVKHNWSFN